MSGGPIRSGDLVAIVRGPSCGGDNAVGFIFVVLHVARFPMVWCRLCRKHHRDCTLALAKETEGVELNRLQRLDPPAEHERSRIPAELQA